MLFFQIVGIVFVVLLLIIIVLFFLYLLFRKDVTPLMADEDMPPLLPLPIPTKNRPFIMRVLVWLFDIRKWQLIDNWHFKLENGFALMDFIAWIGVRIGGCFAWRKHRQENQIPQPPVF
jgi:hypothetical protein